MLSQARFTDLVHWLQAGKTVDILRCAAESTDLLPPSAYDAGWFDIAARTDSAADSKLFAKQMTQMARMDAVRPQANPGSSASVADLSLPAVFFACRSSFEESVDKNIKFALQIFDCYGRYHRLSRICGCTRSFPRAGVLIQGNDSDRVPCGGGRGVHLRLPDAQSESCAGFTGKSRKGT